MDAALQYRPYSACSVVRQHPKEPRRYRRALAIDEKALGPDHPGVATDLNNLGLLLMAEGDYAAAEPLLRRALAIKERALGPDSSSTILTKQNLKAPRESAAKRKQK